MTAILDVLLDPILPVFAIMALGFASGRSGHLTIAEARILNRVVMSVFLPILLFGLTSTAPIHQISYGPLLVYFASEIGVLAAGFAVARVLFRLPPAESFVLAFAAIFTNTVMYVLPISLLIYGEEAALPVTSVVTLDSTVTFAFAVITMQMLNRSGESLATGLGGVFRNPIIIAIALGAAANLSGLEVPPSLRTFIDFNGKAMPPVALFALGVAMSGVRFRVDGVVATYCAAKMLAFPAVVYLGLAAFAPGAGLYFFVAAGPAGAMAFNLALLHNVRPDAVGQVIVLTSVLTLISLAVLA